MDDVRSVIRDLARDAEVGVIAQAQLIRDQARLLRRRAYIARERASLLRALSELHREALFLQRPPTWFTSAFGDEVVL